MLTRRSACFFTSFAFAMVVVIRSVFTSEVSRFLRSSASDQ